MSDEPLISVENVGKKFCRNLKRSLIYGVQDIIADSLGRSGGHDRLRTKEFWANQDISFHLRRGDCLGLIGHNGAGKTTLLKMLNGLIKPDQGKITVRGQVGALIALGAGFNPILTGRENVYINGAVLGLSRKEIHEKLDDIIDFADIGDFIDTPVQNYSSGMQVRLGFAIATAIQPEVLLLDEVLAVGDISFRTKCYSRISKLQETAATILVTHSVSYMSTICNRILYLEHGKGEYFSDASEGIQRYIDHQTSATNHKVGESLTTRADPVVDGTVKLEQLELRHGDDLVVEVTIDSNASIEGLHLRCTATTPTESPVLAWDSSWTDQKVDLMRGMQTIRLRFGPINLISGHYRLNVQLILPGRGEFIFYAHQTASFEMVSKEFYSEINTTFSLREMAVLPVKNGSEAGVDHSPVF